MLDKLFLLLTPLLTPVAVAILNASRRTRLRRRVNHYLELANALEVNDPERAALVRDLVAETIESLVALERKALRRSFDPWALVALSFLIVPSIAVLIWAWTWDEPWKWLVIVVAAIWTLIWGGVGLSQLFKHEGESKSDEAAA